MGNQDSYRDLIWKIPDKGPIPNSIVRTDNHWLNPSEFKVNMIR